MQPDPDLKRLQHEIDEIRMKREKAEVTRLRGVVFNANLTKERNTPRLLGQYLATGFAHIQSENDSYDIFYDHEVYKSWNDLLTAIEKGLTYVVYITQTTDKIKDLGIQIYYEETQQDVMMNYGNDRDLHEVTCVLEFNRIGESDHPPKQSKAILKYTAIKRKQELAMLEALCGVFIIFVNRIRPHGEQVPIGFDHLTGKTDTETNREFKLL